MSGPKLSPPSKPEPPKPKPESEIDTLKQKVRDALDNHKAPQ